MKTSDAERLKENPGDATDMMHFVSDFAD